MRLKMLSVALATSAAIVSGLLVSSPAAATGTGTIAGQVMSSNSIGESGVTVTLEAPITGVSSGLSTTTDQFGNWSLPTVPTGEYVVHYTGPFDGYALDLTGLPGATAYTVSDGGYSFVYDVLSSVTVPPNYSVTEKGSDGASLSLCPRFYPADNIDAGPFGDACSTTAGVTTGIVKPGTYLVELLDYSGQYADTWIGKDGSQAGATRVTIAATGLTDIGTVTVLVAGHIRVQLKAGDTKAPLPGFSCAVAFVGRTQAYGANGCNDGSGGVVTIDGLRPGSYSLQSQGQNLDYVDRWSGDSRTQANASLVSVKSGQTVTAPAITLPLGGVITGTIRDRVTGAPIQGICASTGRFEVVGEEDGTRQLTDSCSDANGHYRIRGLDSGAVKIQFVTLRWQAPPTNYAIAWYDGANHDDAEAVDVKLGKTRGGIDVALAPEGRLSGMAVDANGAAINGFVYADDFRTGYPISYGEDWPGTTFALGFLPTGTVLLHWDTPSGQRYWDGTAYGTPDRAKAVPIRTRAGQTISGIAIKVA